MSSRTKNPTRFLRASATSFDGDGLLHGTATTGLINRYKEEMPGSALDLAGYMNNPVVTWAHQWDELPIGKAVKVWNHIDGDLDALRFAMLFAPHEKAQLVRQLYEERFLNAFSIGFIINEREPVKRGDRKIHRVTAAELLEIAGVSVPADPGALQDVPVFRSYRALVADCLGIPDLSTYGVIPYKDTPKADEDAEWDAGAEVASATTDDLMVMCAWYDSEAEDVKSAYKLPHHKAGGDHAVVLRGVIAAGNVIMGARGGADIPEADVSGVKSHLAKHYHQFDRQAPWEEGEETRLLLPSGVFKRLDHLIHQVSKGRADNPTDLAILREIIGTTLMAYPIDGEGDDNLRMTLAKHLVSPTTDDWLLELDKLVGSRLPSVVKWQEGLGRLSERMRDLGTMTQRQPRNEQRKG